MEGFSVCSDEELYLLQCQGGMCASEAMCESPPTLQKSQNFLDYGLFGSQYHSQSVENYRFCVLCGSSYWDVGHTFDLFHGEHEPRQCDRCGAPSAPTSPYVEHDMGRKEIACANTIKRRLDDGERVVAPNIMRAKKRKRGIKPYAKTIIRNWLSEYFVFASENWRSLVETCEANNQGKYFPRELLRNFLTLEQHFLQLEPKKKHFPHYATTLSRLLELQGQKQLAAQLQIVHHPKSLRKFDMVWWEFCKKEKWPYIQHNDSVLQYIKKKKF